MPNDLFPKLNTPDYSDRIKVRKSRDDSYKIYDCIRHLWVALTPEEWVRQNMTHYIAERLELPVTRFAIEAQIEYNGLKKRCDTIIYDDHLKPMIIVEYKQPMVNITQHTFDQVAVYNMKLNVPYLIVSNGLQHYMCQVDIEHRRYVFTDKLNYNG